MNPVFILGNFCIQVSKLFKTKSIDFGGSALKIQSLLSNSGFQRTAVNIKIEVIRKVLLKYNMSLNVLHPFQTTSFGNSTNTIISVAIWRTQICGGNTGNIFYSLDKKKNI